MNLNTSKKKKKPWTRGFHCDAYNTLLIPLWFRFTDLVCCNRWSERYFNHFVRSSTAMAVDILTLENRYISSTQIIQNALSIILLI